MQVLSHALAKRMPYPY